MMHVFIQRSLLKEVAPKWIIVFFFSDTYQVDLSQKGFDTIHLILYLVFFSFLFCTEGK